ncbi:polyribonucleotide nucleotidyltransferase [Desulfonatronum thiosulfatophilum]|uniref:Polyribonucleotide nucleotidyltransferase n=1 Tax=Desulfonatronum thiosulfatophilum TaxID=617002 RepID=A0A1G6DIS0_9BACT|nr:polyribonucleotide nucleotidyltransferase [Desulfonatronum thiosulfatophilum]SDB45043.1 polyribonucleotide nucleotidyltransferase [Desulfonatronum thiosulfatophilum]
MNDFKNCTRLTTNLDGKEFILETGRMANQADGAVWVQCGDTVVLVTAVAQALDREVSFLPLTVNYQEMSYAAGQIPGNYFRREIGRPSDRETLVSRVIDRPIRPMFPKKFPMEIQVIATVLSSDPDNDPDVLALTGASAALHVSRIPFAGPIAGIRVGCINGEFVLNPSYKDLAESTLNLVMAASRDAVVMVEAGATFVPESLIAKALEWGQQQIIPLLDLQDQLRESVGKPKLVPKQNVIDPELSSLVRGLALDKLEAALRIPEKAARKEAQKGVHQEVLQGLVERCVDIQLMGSQINEILEALEKEVMRARIHRENVRLDGRNLTTVRPIDIQVGLLPRTHGSALFTRGETKALAVATMGSIRDEQRLDTLGGESTKRFMLHYNFPPYCVGEARMLRGPSRREIGHGQLAERALTPVLPQPEDYPFTLRIVSEVMESNGSSSMATVCGASLALMDAGVPITEAVAGIAMGLIKEGDDYLVLTDILGAEDHLGDMDFKVAGTVAGITAIQMDIKIGGIPTNVLSRALDQARDARLHILEQMNAVMDKPREELSPYAPQLSVVHINPEKIREVIGPGGKTVKAITAATGASVDIDDSGKISIFAPTKEALNMAVDMVTFYNQVPEIGKDYTGRVKKIIEFGAVVEILPGVEGLVHVSQLDTARVEQVADVVQLGQELKVKVIEVEPSGRVRLSRKAVIMEERGEEFDMASAVRPSGPRRDSGRDRDRGRNDRQRR